MNWLNQATEKVAVATGAGAKALELSADEVRALLEVARFAAHTSGDRTNAPLLCYVLGLAQARGDALAAAASAVSQIGETA